MSARREVAYVCRLYCVIRFCETCGHNKLCPYCGCLLIADIHLAKKSKQFPDKLSVAQVFAHKHHGVAAGGVGVAHEVYVVADAFG